ncbi:unnamed protein product [Caenorhabditis brenneri]
MPIEKNHGIVCKIDKEQKTIQIFNFYHHTMLEMPVNCDKALEIGDFIEMNGEKQELVTDPFIKMGIHTDDLEVDARYENELHLTVRVLCPKTGTLEKEHDERYGGKVTCGLLGHVRDSTNELGRYFKMGKQVTVLVKFEPKENHLFDVVKEVERVYVPPAKGKKDTKSVEKENAPVEAQEPIEKKKGPGRPRSKTQPVASQSKVKKELEAKEQSSKAEVPASRIFRKSSRDPEEPEKEAKLSKQIEAKRPSRKTTRAQKKATEAQATTKIRQTQPPVAFKSQTFT